MLANSVSRIDNWTYLLRSTTARTIWSPSIIIVVVIVIRVGVILLHPSTILVLVVTTLILKWNIEPGHEYNRNASPANSIVKSSLLGCHVDCYPIRGNPVDPTADFERYFYCLDFFDCHPFDSLERPCRQWGSFVNLNSLESLNGNLLQLNQEQKLKKVYEIENKTK